MKSPSRLSTGFSALDRVFGGGLTRGFSVYFGGPPGVGKITLAIQMAFAFARQGLRVSFLSRDMLASDLSRYVGRIVAGETSDAVERVCVHCDLTSTGITLEVIDEAMADESINVVVIDSVMTASVGKTSGTPHAVSAVVERMVTQAKKTGKIAILLGHFNKNGEFYGHLRDRRMVDAVVRMSMSGDTRKMSVVRNGYGRSPAHAILKFTEHGFEEI